MTFTSQPTKHLLLRALLPVIVLVTLPASVAIAQEAARVPLKIAVVDLDRVFLQSSLGKQLQQELRTLDETTRAQIEGHARKMEELRASLVGKSPDEQRAIARQREDEELAIRRLRDDATRRAAKMEAERRQQIETKLQPVFEKVQEEQGFDLILNKAPGIVVFAKESIDITAMILERVEGS